MIVVPQKNFVVINKTMCIVQDWLLITVLIANQSLDLEDDGFMGTMKGCISVLKKSFLFCFLKLENNVLKWKYLGRTAS